MILETSQHDNMSNTVDMVVATKARVAVLVRNVIWACSPCRLVIVFWFASMAAISLFVLGHDRD